MEYNFPFAKKKKLNRITRKSKFFIFITYLKILKIVHVVSMNFGKSTYSYIIKINYRKLFTYMIEFNIKIIKGFCLLWEGKKAFLFNFKFGQK